MSSKLKWIGIAITALILILFVLPFLIPVNKFRPTIEQKASEALGRKVQLGNLSLSILSGSLGIGSWPQHKPKVLWPKVIRRFCSCVCTTRHDLRWRQH